MKLKLLLTAALLLGLSSPSFAQDTTPPSPFTEVAAFDAGPAADAMPTAPAVVEEAAPAEEAPVPKKESAVESSEKPSALSNLSEALMDIIVPAFSTLILGLFAAILAWVKKKFKLEVSDKAIYQWSLLAEKAAARGGEWARNKAKDLAEGERVPGPDVLEVAVDWAVETGRAYGLPEMGREKLIGLIEGHLHTKRLELGTGA